MSHARRSHPLLSLFALLCVVAPAKGGETAALDALFADALKKWHAPGMAVVIVRDDAVVYLKGLGVRETGTDAAVTPDTLFGIGSLTKAFTATTLGLLVDDGKLAWDDPVRKHVPFFHLADPLADRDVTIRDLLCHRTGLARHDLLWYRAPWPPEESVRRMAFLKPSTSFRSTYEYCNLTYLAAGLAITSAAGEPWHEYMTKRLLTPLDMKRVVFRRGDVLKADDHATPHRFGAGRKPFMMEWYPDDKQVRASGSIKTCVRDLAGWLRVQLNGGMLGDRRVVPAAILAETNRPQVVVPVDADAREARGDDAGGLRPRLARPRLPRSAVARTRRRGGRLPRPHSSAAAPEGRRRPAHQCRGDGGAVRDREPAGRPAPRCRE